MTNHMTQEERMIPQADAGEISAAELGAQMTQEMPDPAHQEEQEQEAALDAVREGIGELFEDGWTAQELAAFSQDPAAREAIAKGHSVARAACAYLRAKMSARRHGVPTARTIATGAHAQENPVENMTDEQFDAFSRRAQAAMMEGKKVRM